MPSWKLEFALEAIEETREARKWYTERSRSAEQAFLLELRRALSEVREAPLRWPIFDEPYRHFVLRKYPFNIVYRVSEDRIQILALAHQKRRPGYWKRRR